MKIKPLKESYWKVIKRIQDSIPKEWQEKLVKKVPQSPTMKLVCERAIKDPNVGEELKKKAQTLLDSGLLDTMVEVVDKRYEKYIDNYVQKEIESAVKRGELPKGKKGRNLIKKVKQLK